MAPEVDDWIAEDPDLMWLLELLESSSEGEQEAVKVTERPSLHGFRKKDVQGVTHATQDDVQIESQSGMGNEKGMQGKGAGAAAAAKAEGFAPSVVSVAARTASSSTTTERSPQARSSTVSSATALKRPSAVTVEPLRSVRPRPLAPIELACDEDEPDDDFRCP